MKMPTSKLKIVLLTGAGISAESGLRTFRDSDGLWEGYSIEDVATPRAWKKNPKLVLDFYNMRRRDVVNAQPNAAHLGIAALQDDFDVHVITQNVDDLHERAGSNHILHLHGEVLKMRSECNEHLVYNIHTDMQLGEKAEDGCLLRPYIVWFEEPVPLIEKAVPIMQSADIFVLVGTSLAVYPAAGLVDYVHPDVPKFIIDKNIPPVSQYENVIPICMTATLGVPHFINQLYNFIQ